MKTNLNNKKNFSKTYKILLIIFGVLILALILIIVWPKEEKSLEKKEITTTLSLFGKETITLQTGEKYVEPGYYAIDSNGVLKTNEIKVSNNIDTTKAGTYTVTYQILNETKTRTVIVQGEDLTEEKEGEEKTIPLTLTLKGENVINLSRGEEYVEAGYEATGLKGQDLTDKVLVSGVINTNKVGNYTLNYSIQDESEIKQVIRTIIVLDDDLTITVVPSETNYTKELSLNIVVQGNNFTKLILPDQSTSDKNITNYKVTNNGTYTVTALNVNGRLFSKTITVNNIDRNPPTGTCMATINNNNTTTINVSASDAETAIQNYIYYDNANQIMNTTSSNYIYNQKTSTNVYVRIYDKAANEKFIYCTTIDNSSLPPILPAAGDNVVKKSETETLKVYIIKKGSYYITRIWAKNPYEQLNKFDSPEYGKNLYKPKTLLEKAKTKYNLNNQLLIGFNASGFYLADTYDASSVSKYSKYNKTSVGTLVITNGKVIRNVYNKAYKTWYILGVSKDNKLQIFTDSKASSSSDIKKKQAWADSVIASGIRNTFTFASPLIQNGKKSSVKTSMPSPSTKENRQSICQIDDNNFALVTGKDLNRSILQDIMLNLHCKTGSNLDGGGSIALLYQAHGTNSISTIIGNSRALTEVGYFSE